MMPVLQSMISLRCGASVTLVIMIATAGGCESALDQDRDELKKLRESIGSVQILRDQNAISPQESDPDLLAKLTDPTKQDQQLENILKILQHGEVREMALAECRQATLANNLNLQADFIDPQMAEQSVREQQAKFESTFNLSVMDSKSLSPYYYGTGSGSQTFLADSMQVVPSIQVPLRTGGSVELDWTVNSQFTETSVGGSGVQATSDITLTFEQPLLRNAWMDYNEASIVLAESQEGEATAATQLSVVHTLLNAEQAYWDVYLAWETLEIQLEIYKRTKSILADTRELVQRNEGSISSVYNFEVTLAQSVQSVITAELDLRLRVRDLKATIQDSSITLDSGLAIKPSTVPRLISYDFDREKLVKIAIENRADLLQLEFEQVSDAVQILMAKNQMLPDLDLTAAYTWNGLNGVSRSIRQATDNLFQNDVQGGWQFGVTASVPLGNEAAIAAYQSTLLKRLQSIANIRAQEILVTQEVLNAVDSLEAGWETILTARYQVSAAQRNLDAMTTLFQESERTSTDLANAINLLALAQTTEAKAQASYQVDLAQLASSIGCMMGHSGIEWSDYANLGMLEGNEPLPPPIVGDTGDAERADLPDPSVAPNPVDVDAPLDSQAP